MDRRFYFTWYDSPSSVWHYTKFNCSSSDTVETYFDSHVDLIQRKLQKHSDRLKLKAEETFKIKDLKIKDLSGDLLPENIEREIKNFKLKVCIFCVLSNCAGV